MPPLRAVVSLALPTTAVMVVGATSNVLHTYFVSRLGATAIAAVSLVFPISLVATAMMAGGIGSGVATAIAQALGSGRRAEAERIAEQAFLITLIVSVAFTVGLWAGAPGLFRLMGGRDEVLSGASRFARVLFGGAVITFTVSTCDSILRGEGNVRIPSIGSVISLTLQIVFTPICMFLLGMGLPGAAVATLAGQVVGMIPRGRHIFSGRGALQPRIPPTAIAVGPAAAILRIGIPASLGTFTNYLGLMLLTAIVTRYGVHEIAAFGLGTRLDFLVLTLTFGVGSAVLTLVGLARGAGDVDRARTIVSQSLRLVGSLLLVLGGLLVVWPGAWLRFFTEDPEILEIGAHYLRAVAPSYPFLGASMIFAFGLQAQGRAVFPFLITLARTVVVLSVAVAIASTHASISWLFVAMSGGNVAVSLLLFWRLRMLWREGYGATETAPLR